MWSNRNGSSKERSQMIKCGKTMRRFSTIILKALASFSKASVKPRKYRLSPETYRIKIRCRHLKRAIEKQRRLRCQWSMKNHRQRSRSRRHVLYLCWIRSMRCHKAVRLASCLVPKSVVPCLAVCNATRHLSMLARCLARSEVVPHLEHTLEVESNHSKLMAIFSFTKTCSRLRAIIWRKTRFPELPSSKVVKMKNKSEVAAKKVAWDPYPERLAKIWSKTCSPSYKIKTYLQLWLIVVTLLSKS